MQDDGPYIFQSSLFRTDWEMHKACAEAFLSAGGLNNAQDIREFFAETTDAALAQEAWEGWGLGRDGEEEYNTGEPVPSKWSLETLVKALAYLRENVDEAFPLNKVDDEA